MSEIFHIFADIMTDEQIAAKKEHAGEKKASMKRWCKDKNNFAIFQIIRHHFKLRKKFGVYENTFVFCFVFCEHICTFAGNKLI